MHDTSTMHTEQRNFTTKEGLMCVSRHISAFQKWMILASLRPAEQRWNASCDGNCNIIYHIHGQIKSETRHPYDHHIDAKLTT
ncbi:hypothetical protein RRG08_018037 [Elysia crispata]|uniref:Uncharacterized protein n=1 Tax=Elysia crispata TaxID=231223 RepID=A0AAE0ZDZ6_9GAST|nr:hypothetical protein RRG08_018037 [Elysia crispata]